MRRHFGLGAAALTLAPLAAGAQGSLSRQGFGYPPGELSARSLATGGALGEFDPQSPINPGSLAAWGDDGYGQVSATPTGTGFTAVAAGGYDSLALRADGSLVSSGQDYFCQVSGTPAGTRFTAVAAGAFHSLAVRALLALTSISVAPAGATVAGGATQQLMATGVVDDGT